MPALGAVLGGERGEQLFNKSAVLVESMLSNFGDHSEITARLLKIYCAFVENHRASDLSNQCAARR